MTAEIDRRRAAACGDAIDVPEKVAFPVSLAYDAEVIETPGANRSTAGPKFEKAARASFLSVAPTAMASFTSAGSTGRPAARRCPPRPCT